MTKVRVNPGVCGFIAEITAENIEDDDEIEVTVDTKCPTVSKMMESLGNRFDAYSVCMAKPGTEIFHQYAAKNYSIHAACPMISAIIKTIEAEAGLALKKNVSIEFVE